MTITVTIGVASREELSTRFKRAMEHRQAGEARYRLSRRARTLWGTRTPLRRDILKVMTAAGPLALRTGLVRLRNAGSARPLCVASESEFALGFSGHQRVHTDPDQTRIVRLLVEKVIVSPDALEVRLRANGIEQLALEICADSAERREQALA